MQSEAQQDEMLVPDMMTWNSFQARNLWQTTAARYPSISRRLDLRRSAIVQRRV